MAQGKRELRKLLSKKQRAFFAAHAPDGVQLDGLTLLRARALLSSSGIDLSGDQQTKTRKALEFFSERLSTAS